ncbi:MAG: Lrp/AsnC family transcriptional regulator [bacterium]
MDDRKFIDVAAKGLAVEPSPFQALAEKLGISESEVIEKIGRLKEEGKVRRFAASVRHQPMGYSENAMVIARTDEDNLDRVGQSATTIDAVSHCYQRPHPDGDPWCVYIMIHGRGKDELERSVEQITKLPGIRGIEVCSSTAELKKSSVSGVTTELNEE